MGTARRDLSRRSFLSWLAVFVAAAAGFTFHSLWRRRTAARFVGPALDRGHKLRETLALPKIATHRRIPIAIVGGGISGLSAAWYLQRRGFKNFRVFELEDRAGGNARWGENRNGRFPWGAHYLPTPGPDAFWVRELLAEMGIYRHGKFSEEVMVHEPEERLFIFGQWQPGLVPLLAARESDRKQIEQFLQLMASFSRARGSDGRRAFTIPLELSSRDDQYLRYDRYSAAEYLEKNGFNSPRLLWYIDYVLRDEYGANRHNASAWALLHYFAARSNAHNLVWPEGNGFIAEYLRERTRGCIEEATLLRHIRKEKGEYQLYFTHFTSGETAMVVAQKIIFAAPKFILPWVYPELAAKKREVAQKLVYSPWLTVNLLVNHFAENSPAWDNVIYGSKSLGYVVAEHQRAGKLSHARTLTFFHAFDEDDTLATRRNLLRMTENAALELALADIARAHPRVGNFIESAGIYRWAHAMVRPLPGVITGKARRELQRIDRNFFGAHSDVSGMSNFEEAQYQGIKAAQLALDEG